MKSVVNCIKYVKYLINKTKIKFNKIYIDRICNQNSNKLYESYKTSSQLHYNKMMVKIKYETDN